MKNVTQFPNPVNRAFDPAGVAVLTCQTQMHFDPDPVQRLYVRHPVHEAEEMICRILEDIALRLDHLQRGLGQSDFAQMVKPARRAAVMAEQIGLLEVAVSAGHVRRCLTQGDGTAVEATMARLERAFDLAVNEIWNLRDM